MATFQFGDSTIEVGPENEKQFDAAGWSRVEDAKPSKADKAPAKDAKPE